jgi:hypothetical protein
VIITVSTITVKDISAEIMDAEAMNVAITAVINVML